MQQRISAGAIVFRGGKVLLVRHYQPSAYDFLGLPGGGVNPGEDAAAAARREAFEETAIRVEPVKLIYVEETQLAQMRECKLWFLCEDQGGAPSATAIEAAREGIVQAGFYSRAEIGSEQVYPPILLTDKFWHMACGVIPDTEYLGLRERGF